MGQDLLEIQYMVFKEFGSGSNLHIITGSGSATPVEWSIVIKLLATIYLEESVQHLINLLSYA